MKKYRKRITGISAIIILFVVVNIKFDLLAYGGNIYVQIEKFLEVIKKIQQLYVEEVNPEMLVDGAIKGMLEELDPHSVYIPKERMQVVGEQFEGEFEGIGIEFIIHKKLPTIMSPITGSPSEKMGLRPGDQITSIEGKATYGISESGVREKLLGPMGTQVSMQIQRPGLVEPFEITITRDIIPVNSITIAFMFDDSTGFIKIGRFSKTTNDEFAAAVEELKSKGMKQLLLDLRGNAGGYLDQAVKIVDKFIDGNKRIVYTIGRTPNSSEDYYSTSRASDLTMPLIVLIDHGSASASEIVGGAIQDWDRGLIVGTTSFGKGLVQRQEILKDGSAVRVTIARYYTPSGRLIQRSYKNGIRDYISAGWDDMDPNAIADSTLNKPVFTTNSGRKVFGGGGISPDIIIKSKPLTITTIKLIQNQLFFEYGSQYARNHKKLKKDFQTYRDKFNVSDKMVEEVINLAKSKNIELNEEHILNDDAFIKQRIKSQIARNLWSTREYYHIEVFENGQVQEAIKYFPEAVKLTRLN